MGSKRNPGHFDCYGNAAHDEEMFILLARDSSAPTVVRVWAVIRFLKILFFVKPWSDLAMVREAFGCARRMKAWRKHKRAWLEAK